jgi:Flp pilus assembly protein TadB
MKNEPSDPNQLRWPPLRSDVVAVACLIVAIVLIALGQWPAIVTVALVGAIFAGLSPRMIGRFRVDAGAAKIQAEFDRPRSRRDPPAKRGRAEEG